jgi:hypothetical protein
MNSMTTPTTMQIVYFAVALIVVLPCIVSNYCDLSHFLNSTLNRRKSFVQRFVRMAAGVIRSAVRRGIVVESEPKSSPAPSGRHMALLNGA